MKKFIAAMSVVTVLSIAGCASSPWDGMPYQEANEWQAIGVNPNTAFQLRQNAFTPIDAKPWIQAGINSPNQIVTWHQAGFNPQETAKWLAKGFTLQRAIDLKKQGLTVE